ncbi:MAG: rhomboid-like protein [Myxococcota bacterium]|jgi:membrane associated rhomboid family serine protease
MPNDSYSIRKRRLLSHYSPRLLWVLIGINVVVYVLWQLARRNADPVALTLGSVGVPMTGWTWLFSQMQENFILSLDLVQSGRIWTILTSEFSHVEPTHLLFNMFGLFVFGSAVHEVVRDVLFVKLYIMAAVTASLAHIAWSAITGDPTGALGASGAVMGIAVVYAFLFPERRLLLFFVVPVPAGIAVLLFIGIDMLGVVGVFQDRTAHMAHLGGVAYGAAFWLLWLRKRIKRVPPR